MTLFVLDGTHRLRAVLLTPPFSVSTVAGSGVATFADGIGPLASFSSPRGLALEPNPLTPALYVSDTGNSVLRRVSLAPASYARVSTFSGTPLTPGFANGASSVSRFNRPGHVFVSPWNYSLLLADSANHLVRSIVTADGSVDTFAGALGGGFGGGSGWATGGALTLPDGGIAAPAAEGGAIFVSDTFSNVVRVISCGISQSASFSPTPSVTSGVTPSVTATVSPSMTPSPTSSFTATMSMSQTPSATPTAPSCLSVRFIGNGAAGLAAATGGATGQVNTPSGLAVDWSGVGALYFCALGRVLRALVVSCSPPFPPLPPLQRTEPTTDFAPATQADRAQQAGLAAAPRCGLTEMGQLRHFFPLPDWRLQVWAAGPAAEVARSMWAKQARTAYAPSFPMGES